MSRRNVRRRKGSDEDSSESEGDVVDKISELVEQQKFRARSKGLSAAELAIGKKLGVVEHVENDPFKLATSGLLEVHSVKDRNRDRSGEEREKDVADLRSTFSQETHRRDEDFQMLNFIEQELAKRKGVNINSIDGKRYKSADDYLFEVPAHLNIPSKAVRSEDMLSEQMLSGIPEVDLGVQAKIKNIENTELAKLRLMHESLKTGRGAQRAEPAAASSLPVVQGVPCRFAEERKPPERVKQEVPALANSPSAPADGVPTVRPERFGGACITSYASSLLGRDRTEQSSNNIEDPALLFKPSRL